MSESKSLEVMDVGTAHHSPLKPSSPSFLKGRTSPRGNRGSFLVLGAFVILFVIMLFTFVLDMSYYYYRQKQLQNVTESAALAGAQALNQFQDDPDTAAAYSAALRHIRDNQGDEYADLYEVHSPTDVDGIDVYRVENSSGTVPCEPEFDIDNGSIAMMESTALSVEVLGTALEYPVEDFFGNYQMEPGDATVRIKVTTSDGTKIIEPWGFFESRNDGNVNKPGGGQHVELTEIPAGANVDVRARSYLWDNPAKVPPWVEYDPSEDAPIEPWMDISTDDPADTQQVFTLRDGQQVPDIEGFGDQGDMESFAANYLGPDGRAQLETNEAIFFFEITHDDASDSGFDNQDVVVLASLEPESQFSSTLPSFSEEQNYCGESPQYRVGVLGKDVFEPLILPSWMVNWMDDDGNGSAMFHTAVAQIGPENLAGPVDKQLPCGVYADHDIVFDEVGFVGENFTLHASPTSFCANQDVNAGSVTGPEFLIGNVFVPKPKEAHYIPPGQGASVRNVIPFEGGSKQMPTFKHTDPADYDVNLTNYDQWDHLGRCYLREQTNPEVVRRPSGTPRGIQAAQLLPFPPSIHQSLQEVLGWILSGELRIPQPSMDFTIENPAPSSPQNPGPPSDDDPSDDDPPGDTSSDDNTTDGDSSNNNPSDNDPSNDNPSNDSPSNNNPSDNNPSDNNPSDDDPADGQPPQEPQYEYHETVKALRTQGSHTADVRWSGSGLPVCVKGPDDEDFGEGRFRIVERLEQDEDYEEDHVPVVVTDSGDTVSDGGSGMIEMDGGDAVTIYSDYDDGDVLLSTGRPASDFKGIHGGLYATGDIKVHGAGSQSWYFKGDVNHLGGLALWAGGSIRSPWSIVNFKMVRGIMGTNSGDILIDSGRWNATPNINGIVVSGDDLIIKHAHQLSKIFHNTDTYDESALAYGDWQMEVFDSSALPDYASTEVYIANSRPVGARWGNMHD